MYTILTLRAGTALALAAFVLAVPPAARAQSVALEPPATSIGTRENLGGDWGGVRDTAGRHGVDWNLWATGLYQGMFSGTGPDDFEFGVRADLMVSANTGKMGLWEGGGLHAHLTYRGGELSGFRGGALWPVNTAGVLPLGSKDELVATSLYLSQRLGESTGLMLGKVNAVDLLASHPFFGGWGTNRFWNTAFVAPPSGVLPPVFMGAVVSHAFAPYRLTLMVFDPNDQTTNYSLSRLFEDGVNVSAGLAWSGALAGHKASLGLTAIYSTAEGTDWETIGLPPGAQTTTKQGMYSVAVEGSTLLAESAHAPGKGLGLYAKAAIADGNPNPIRSSFIGGIAGHAIVPGRPLDTFGIGYFYYNFSNQLQRAVASVLSFEDEQGFEAYYSFAVTPWFHVSGDLQVVNPATGANKTAVVGGLRARVIF